MKHPFIPGPGCLCDFCIRWIPGKYTNGRLCGLPKEAHNSKKPKKQPVGGMTEPLRMGFGGFDE